MTKPKWGESFLKTGLPLEHLTAVTLRQAGWNVDMNPEFERPNAKGKSTWFSVDMQAGNEVHFEGYFPWCTALIPTIVTNARIFRLRPSVSALDQIRVATAPTDIADELAFGLLAFDPPIALHLQNNAATW